MITLNSGEKDFGRLGAITHVGQDEVVAGQGAGSRFKSEGVKKLLILVHEQGNVGLEERFSRAKPWRSCRHLSQRSARRRRW